MVLCYVVESQSKEGERKKGFRSLGTDFEDLLDCCWHLGPVSSIFCAESFLVY